ncbi:MAG: DUF72 domain-containing protein [Alphaproteobacteria bacterium]|nr:DUF72 domain-containing protein [Alphaproteobacteria bacterium]
MIRVGIGGWTFEPWKDSFYPKGLSAAKELGFASRAVTTIEVNGTFYSTFKPPTFQKWFKETPDDFVFALKANRFCVNRKVLGDAGESIERFLGSGVEELGPKLGPILWQLAGTKKFDPGDVEAFLKLLPKKLGKLKLRHALEARHESFRTPEFVALAKKHNAAIVYADSEDYPAFADLTADFVYARLQSTKESEKTGYSTKALNEWVKVAKAWEKGEAPKSLEYADGPVSDGKPRDVFVYMIAGAKEKNPHAAMAMIEKL